MEGGPVSLTSFATQLKDAAIISDYHPTIDAPAKCDDGHTYCYPGIELCKSGGGGVFGTCDQIENITSYVKVYWGHPLYTETEYIATSVGYSSEKTDLYTELQDAQNLVTATVVVTDIMTYEITVAGPTITTTVEVEHRRGLCRRDTITFEVDITTSVYLDDYCVQFDDQSCTVTEQEVSTEWQVYTISETALPAAATTDPTAACFLASSYSAFYSTPTWYSTLPSAEQSYYAAANAQNPAACKGNTTTPASGGGMSAGARAGAGVGSAAGVAALPALLLWLWKTYEPLAKKKPSEDNEKDALPTFANPPPAQDPVHPHSLSRPLSNAPVSPTTPPWNVMHPLHHLGPINHPGIPLPLIAPPGSRYPSAPGSSTPSSYPYSSPVPSAILNTAPTSPPTSYGSPSPWKHGVLDYFPLFIPPSTVSPGSGMPGPPTNTHSYPDSQPSPLYDPPSNSAPTSNCLPSSLGISYGPNGSSHIPPSILPTTSVPAAVPA
ncbi:hypothetical protein BDV96DRAFT_648678 [Lophiotrema nucula]|uniref:Uncharacterized protein n=1 Tax=Lophiotrema nucula TaxID=690887 RepID=A0A6A5Z425_9PLEO|nr:hypothetical protein BDV96DRAFT_648678 [Lophiotrema nucula]